MSRNKLDEVDAIIKDLLEKNSNIQEEVKKLKREQEIKLVRLCEVMKEKSKAKEEIEGKSNEIQKLSLQQANFIDQLTNANEDLMNLRSKTKRLQNELNIQNQTYERMMKSQESMNQFNEQSQYRHKGKVGIGYIEEGESSQQGAQKNKRPTCNHYGKIGHTSNKFWSNGKAKFNGMC